MLQFQRTKNPLGIYNLIFNESFVLVIDFYVYGQR